MLLNGVSYEWSDRLWHSHFDYELFRLPDLEMELRAGIFGPQGTPPDPMQLWYIWGLC
jgi:hypothetical protein